MLGSGHVKPRSCHITAVNNVPGRAPRAARAETRVAGPGTQHSHGGHVCDVMRATCVTYFIVTRGTCVTLQSRGARDVCDLLYSREDTCVTSQSRGHVCDVSDVMASPRSVFTVIRTRVFNHSTVTMDTCDVMGHVTTLMISW